MSRLPTLLALLASTLGPSLASAAIIGSTGYEGPPDFANGYYYTYSYDYAGYGNGGPNNDLGGAPVNAAVNVEPGVGAGLSGAFVLSADATAVPVPGQPYPTPADPIVQYSYWGMGGGSGLAVQNVPTSVNLADYLITMDLRAIGMTTPTVVTEFNIEFQVPDDTLGGDPDTNGDVILGLNFFASDGKAFLVGADFATFAITLDLHTSIGAGSLLTFEQYGSMLTNINVNIATNNGAGEFGLDSGNALIVDNLMIEQIPEPATTGLFAFLGVGWSMLRRRTAAC
jgi:hypothetical protein